MAITFGPSGGQVNSASSGASWSISVPSGIQDGDSWLIAWFKDDNFEPDAIPSGFTRIDADVVNAGEDDACGACINYYATAPVSAVTFDNTSDSGEAWRTVGYWVRGLDVSTPDTSMIAGSANAGGDANEGTAPVCPAPSAGGASGDITFAMACARVDITPATVVQPTGMTLLHAGQASTSNGIPNAVLAYEDYVDDSSHTWSAPDAVAGTDWSQVTFVLKAAAGGGGGLGIPIAAYHHNYHNLRG